jgi:hypothetical protein
MRSALGQGAAPVFAPASRAGRSSSWTAAANVLQCSSGRRRRSARKPGIQTYFTRPSPGRPAARPWSRIPFRLAHRRRDGTGTLPRERLSTARPLAAPAPSARDTPPAGPQPLRLTSADDHLVISNLVAEGHRTLAHAPGDRDGKVVWAVVRLGAVGAMGGPDDGCPVSRKSAQSH